MAAGSFLAQRNDVMQQYVIKRLLLVLPTLLIITLIVFALTRLIPGDVVELMFQEQGYAKDLAAMRAMLGLDRPLHLQYLSWLGEVLRGDFGTSLWTKNPVLEEILYRLPVTLELGMLAMVFAVSMAIPIGVLAAIRQDTLQDYAARSFAIGGLSIPNFWLATIAIVLPAYYFGWTPPIQYIKLADNAVGHLGQFLLPAFILGLSSGASVMRLTRAMMLEVLRQDYVRTALSKGLRERVVVLKHALRNAIIPVITILGIQLAQVAGGTVIMESIFGLPGMGKFLFDALLQRDYPVVQGVNLLLASIIVLMNLITDVTYALIDPRIRYQ
jgi:peptide/nickel transport system permease protein